MAMNPMQRRARNSFLTGMLVTLIVAAVIVIGLLYKINQLNEDKEKLIALQQTVYVAAEDISSGGEITTDMLITDVVQTSMDTSDILTPDSFYEYGDDDVEYLIEYTSKIDIPAGTIITMDMVSEVGEEITSDTRVQEYNMIILPSQLTNGDYIDIRFKLASGTDYIVLSKKKVLQCNEDTIWINVTEDEILTLGCAIVECYKSTGSKIYATTYVEPGMQEAATQTYAVSTSVYSQIQNNPNVLEEAKNALWERYNDQNYVAQRNDELNNAVTGDDSAVQTGVETETSALQSARQTFVESLEGTGEVGTSY